MIIVEFYAARQGTGASEPNQRFKLTRQGHARIRRVGRIVVES